MVLNKYIFSSPPISQKSTRSPTVDVNVICTVTGKLGLTSICISWSIHSASVCWCVCAITGKLELIYGLFNYISFHKFSQQLSIFSLCSSGLNTSLLILSTIYLFTKVSLSTDIILYGWLGFKHQLTNYLTLKIHWLVHLLKWHCGSAASSSAGS